MSALAEGQTHASRELNGGMYLKTGDPGLQGGGTYSGGTETEGTLAQYENIFGPAGRDIKQDNQRHKRHQRWHLPDALKGHNQYLTDRVDGLITDATNSPFTRNILPYKYLENPDQKLKWNVYSFDEGIASRVPYEAAARVLPQTKRSFAGYTVRQGLAIAMEHNFMVSAAGRENFKNQLTQLVGSIQLTNDLDVHVALLQAPSYQKHMNEKYYDNTKTTAQMCRQYIDLFGIMQKVPNAMDILIEDAKSNLQTWGSQPPTFVLCNSALTSQLTMLPEKTNFVTNGPDGLKRLAEGPNLSSYRGLSIIPSRKFSMDAGTAPRDLLRRRVRVAEYYRIPWQPDNVNRSYEFYDQSRDSMFTLSWQELFKKSNIDGAATHIDDDSYRSGVWHFDSMVSQKIPAIRLNTFAPTKYPYGLTLCGRMAQYKTAMSPDGPASCRYLSMGGFTSSADPARVNEKKTMSLQEVIAETKLFKPNDRELVGVNGFVFDHNNDDAETALTSDITHLCEQSEMAGHGIFSDPLSTSTHLAEERTRLSLDLTSLHQHGVRHDFMKHWMVVYFFQFLDDRFNEMCTGGNKHFIDSLSKSGDVLANTPFSDLGCLGDKLKGVIPLFHHTTSSVGMQNEYVYTTLIARQYKMGFIPGAGFPAVAPVVAIDGLTHGNTEYIIDALSNDGDLSVTGWLKDATRTIGFSRSQVLETLKTLFNIAVNDVDFYNFITTEPDNIPNATSILLPAEVLGVANPNRSASVPFLMNDESILRRARLRMTLQNFKSVKDNPNLFFMWVMCTHWSDRAGAAYTALANLYIRKNETLDSTHIAILDAFRPDVDNWNSISAEIRTLIHQFACHIGNARYSHQKECADVMRCVHNLQELFDVPNITNVEAIAGNAHRMTIDIMITASEAFVRYRQNIQVLASLASTGSPHVYSKEDANVLAAAIAHNSLTEHCMNTNFVNNVILVDYNSRATIHAEGHGNRIQHYGYKRHGVKLRYVDAAGAVTAAVQVENPRILAYAVAIALAGVPQTNALALCKSPLYFDKILKDYKNHMSGEHNTVKRTHNIMMITSQSAGSNITHFPNYHLGRCTPLSDSDRNKSASSQDDATWVLQQLAGMMPLSETLCGRMMGIQTYNNTTILQSSEMITGATTDAAGDNLKHPSSIILVGPTGAVAENTYEACVNSTAYTEVPWAAQEYSTNLMQNFMTLFNPNTYVYDNSVDKNIIPDHLKKQVMMAFANAIHENQTMTPELERALQALFPVCVDHVPFCCAKANTHIKVVPVAAHSETDWLNKLKTPLAWRDVPFSLDFYPGRNTGRTADLSELYAARDIRRNEVYLWDAHKNEGFSGANAYWSCDRMSDTINQVSPMRSFCADTLDTPSPMNAAKIHTDLHGAAASAAAFCRDPNNWETFWKHVVLVLVSRFYRASTRFVDNGRGMVAAQHMPVAAGGGAKYFPNGMHLMHGPRVPVFGSNPIQPAHAGAQCDLVLLRPNIEHEMLGVIMGRGGTQELGATFWGQTELSCYDDAQHGIWGMSYKYHERAMVTNERNMIRAYDVAFDGYNGGLDQTCVDWDSTDSIKRFRDSTYDRTKPFSGPSMLVMALPVSDGSRQPWPNPIVYHSDTSASYCPDPEKSQGATPNLSDHVVFNHATNSALCSAAVQDKFQRYMNKLQMTQWINADQSNRPAGEACIANEASSSPMAFQGSMRVLTASGSQIEDIKGSGHLGHSYVGIASVREGRGVLNPAMQHSMMRLV